MLRSAYAITRICTNIIRFHYKHFGLQQSQVHLEKLNRSTISSTAKNPKREAASMYRTHSQLHFCSHFHFCQDHLSLSSLSTLALRRLKIFFVLLCSILHFLDQCFECGLIRRRSCEASDLVLLRCLCCRDDSKSLLRRALHLLSQFLVIRADVDSLLLDVEDSFLNVLKVLDRARVCLGHRLEEFNTGKL